MASLKYCILTLVIVIFGTTSAYAYSYGIILRNADGSIKRMNQYDAMTACPAGTHLPTSRELAAESKANGARGILDPNEPLIPATLQYKIYAVNPDGSNDEFDFNPRGFKLPDDRYGDNRYWSSSVLSYESTFAYSLIGINGGLDYWSRTDNSGAVMCFPN